MPDRAAENQTVSPLRARELVAPNSLYLGPPSPKVLPCRSLASMDQPSTRSEPCPSKLHGARLGLRAPNYRIACVVAVILIFTFPAATHAQLPTGRLNTVFPAGGQRGTTFKTKIVSGADLDETKTMWFSHPGIRAVPTSDSVEGSSEFHVAIDPSVPTGLHEIRAGGLFGLSNPRLFMVGDLPETMETEPNDHREQAGVLTVNSTVNGTISRSGDVEWYRFDGKANQRVLILCDAARLDSTLQPRIELYSANQKRIARARGDHTRDAMIDATLPTDGAYHIRVADQTFRGSNQSVYRLTVHTRPHIDFVMPPAVIAGKKQTITVYGRNIPGGQPAGTTADGQPLQSKTAELIAPSTTTGLAMANPILSDQAGVDGFSWRMDNSNPVLVQFAGADPIREVEPNNQPAEAQPISVPAEVAGQFQAAGDIDRYTFEANKGAVLQIEAFGQRNGSSADPYFTLESVKVDDKGKETTKRLTAQDDNGTNIGGNDFATANSDPAYRFQVPEDGRYRIAIRDRFFDSRGGPELTYRLVIRPAVPDFRLIALAGKSPGTENQPFDQGSIALRRGGHYEVAVLLQRRDGFADAVKVEAQNLPTGVSAKAVWIGAKQSRATLVLQAEPNAVAGHYPIRLVGVSQPTAKDQVPVSRIARPATIVRKRTNAASIARLSQDLIVSVLPGTHALTLTSAVYEVNANQSQQILVPLSVIRQNGFNQNVNITFQGQPANVDVETKPIAKGKSAESFRLFLKNNAPPGTYTLLARGKAAVPFVRNPGKLERETASHAAFVARSTAASKAVAGAKAAIMTAQTAVTNLQKDMDTATKNVKALAGKIETAKKTITKSEAAETATVAAIVMAEKTQAARKVVAAALTNVVTAAPQDKDIAAQKQKADSLAAAANKTLVDAKQLLQTNKKATNASRAQLKALLDEHKKAAAAVLAYPQKIVAEQKRVADLTTKLKPIEDAEKKAKAEQAAALKRLEAVKKQNKPQNINVYEPSTPIVLHIAKSPVAITATVPVGGNVKAGQALAIKVKLDRTGYTEPIQLTVFQPPGLVGITAAPVTVPANGTDATIQLTTTPKATPGAIVNCTVRGRFTHNGRQFVIDAPLKVQVQK